MSAFRVTATDSTTRARTGMLPTAHGTLETPIFMPVGTQATVKTLTVADLAACGVQALLANVYHLMLRPGSEVLEAAGGLHRFMGWGGALLTDSGGFQVFSLSAFRKVTDDGVTFQSPLDGSRHRMTPESVMAFQRLLGSDLVVPLDECVRYPCERREAEVALQRTQLWAQRSHQAFRVQSSEFKVSRDNSEPGTRNSQLFFGIVQGATYPDLRRQAVEALALLAVDGYAIGGLSVGEPRPLMLEVLQATVTELPDGAPRYLMGVGEPLDLIEAIAAGVDMFDCVVPTRHGRNGVAYTWGGKVSIRHAAHRLDPAPLDPSCGCFTCRTHSRSYLHHLFRTQELLGLRLLSLHNVWFYTELMRAARAAIPQGALLSLRGRLAAAYSDPTTCLPTGGGLR